MNQKFGGFTLLDAAKSAVEKFVQTKIRSGFGLRDRFLLVTYAEGFKAIKVGWKENTLDQFTATLKNLSAEDQSDASAALKTAFELLNQYRIAANVDTLAQGRRFWMNESASVVLITDATSGATLGGLKGEVSLSSLSLPGSQLFSEPFRGDQRLFSIRLQMAALAPNRGLRDGGRSEELIPGLGGARPSLGPLCDATGGSSYSVGDLKSLFHIVESLANRTQHGGVAVDFLPEGATLANLKTQFVFVSSSAATTGGNWPLPEDAFVDAHTTTIPSRTSHIQLTYQSAPSTIPSLDGFPSDVYSSSWLFPVWFPPQSSGSNVRYTLEPSSFSEFILKNAPAQGNSGLLLALNKQSLLTSTSPPIGYLKASTAGASLFVLPYNFPVLFALLKEYKQRTLTFSVSAWRQRWEDYIKALPIYYAPFLKTALMRFFNTSLPNTPLYAEVFESINGMNYGMQQSLNALMQDAKADAERREALRLKESNAQNDSSNGDLEDERAISSNVFEISREKLLIDVQRLRQNIFERDPLFGGLYSQRSFGKASAHRSMLDPDKSPRFNVPVAQMGNYQEYLAKQPKLRPLFEDESKERENAFGSPFRLKKKSAVMSEFGDVDEIRDVGFIQTKKRALDDPEMPRPAKRQAVEAEKSATPAALVGADEVSPKPPPPRPQPRPAPKKEVVETKVVEEVTKRAPPPKKAKLPKKATLELRTSAGDKTLTLVDVVSFNDQLRMKILKLIKQPTQPRFATEEGPHAAVFSLLKTAKGDERVRKNFLLSVVELASVFHKQSLYDALLMFSDIPT